MNRVNKLGLGTAQWGMLYGIANRVGQATAVEVGNLIRMAKRQGVMLLDTARAYGEAETVLGRQDVVLNGFRVVSKTPPLRLNSITDRDVGSVSAAFLESLRELKCTQLYGLLVHHADDLLAAGGDRLWAILEGLKAAGRVKKIGASVYQPAQLERILERYPIDLVQLPLNLYDQRFLRAGLPARLRKAGIEIHARSVFLQGLLLFSPARLPEPFSAIRDHHSRLHREIGDAGLTPLEACLRFCLDNPDIDRVIVGCETSEQFGEILGAAERDGACLRAPESYALRDESIIEPSMWQLAAVQ